MPRRALRLAVTCAKLSGLLLTHDRYNLEMRRSVPNLEARVRAMGPSLANAWERLACLLRREPRVHINLTLVNFQSDLRGVPKAVSPLLEAWAATWPELECARVPRERV